MNVLFLTNSLAVGGIETNLVLLSHELAARGHRVSVGSRGGILVSELVAADRVRHVDLEMRPSSPSATARDIRVLRRELRRLADGGGVAHVFSATAAIMLGLARMASGAGPVRQVSSVMGIATDPDEWRTWSVIRACVTNLGAETVVITSPQIGATVNALPVRRSRQVEIPVQGVRTDPPPPEQRRETRRALAIADDEFAVMTIGRLTSTKSHELFIDAAAIVCRQRSDVRFFIVGEGELRAQIEAQIERVGVAGHLTLLGERRDVSALLAGIDVYVRPGIVEGFVGITVLEAQVAGVPVVSFETEDVRLAIDDGVTGVLVARGDVAQLAQAIIRLLDDPLSASRIATAGRQAACDRFGIGVVVDRLEQLYGTLLTAA